MSAETEARDSCRLVALADDSDGEALLTFARELGLDPERMALALMCSTMMLRECFEHVARARGVTVEVVILEFQDAYSRSTT
jgi:hypothetical protein